MTPDLLEDFRIPNVLDFHVHDGGLVRGIVNVDDCTAEFFLHGAHVTQYQPVDDRPVLFSSSNALYEPGKAIRGGIPVCFPWFSAKTDTNGVVDAQAPAHGLVRTQCWELVSASGGKSGLNVQLACEVDDYALDYRIAFSSQLHVQLRIVNRAAIARTHEVALHTYLAVSDIDQVKVYGLEACPYLDQLTGATIGPNDEPIVFREETDRIYDGRVAGIKLVDQQWERSIDVVPEGSQSTVVWNPWIAKSQRMADFGNDEYLRMCCIETANVRKRAVELEPGAACQIGVAISSA